MLIPLLMRILPLLLLWGRLTLLLLLGILPLLFLLLASLIAQPAMRRDRRAWAALGLATGFALLLLDAPGFGRWCLFWTALAVAVLSPRTAPGAGAGRWSLRIAYQSVAGIIAPVLDIILLNRAEQTGFRSRMCQFVTPAVPQGAVSAELAFRDEVDRQVEVLRKYFQSIRATAEAHGIDIGLSGGYDSRLLLLLASESGVPISAHTFAGLAHLLEREIAGELARLTHVELRPVPVRLLEDKDGCEADANIDDALHYYDGRTNMTMGTFNDVHTRAARLTALGARRLGLNGLGGELYRNREHLRRGAINFREWMQYYAFDPAAAAAVKDRKLRGALVEKLGRKYAGLIGVDAGERFDREVARRYYRDVWLPYSAGPKNCAENKLAYFLMPFADPSVTSHSIRINRNLGLAGRFEGAMIRRLSTTVADVPSSYGGGFGRDPVTVSLRAWFHAAVPVWARNLHGRRHAQRSTRRAGSFEIWLPRNDRLLAGLELLRAFGLPLDWGVLLADRVHRDRALFVGQFLHAFRDHVADTRRPVLN